MTKGITAEQAGDILLLVDPDFKFPEGFVFVRAFVKLPQGPMFLEGKKDAEIYNYQSKLFVRNTFWTDLASYYPVTYKKLIS
ncbi:MAG: hypothetical protein KA234_00435 [Saprospiraceae bacterium]|nr:hypothetical protein [Saprospiraceae bacterium]